MGYFAKIAKKGGPMEPEKPCPWHAELIEFGRLVVHFCEVGPEGHEGGHLGKRPRDEYLRRLRVWRAFRHHERRKVNGSTQQS